VKYVPEWVPGAGFKRKAREWRAFVDYFAAAPFDTVKKGMQDGTAASCFVSLALRDIKEGGNRPFEENLIRDVAATIYLGTSCIAFSSYTMSNIDPTVILSWC